MRNGWSISSHARCFTPTATNKTGAHIWERSTVGSHVLNISSTPARSTDTSRRRFMLALLLGGRCFLNGLVPRTPTDSSSICSEDGHFPASLQDRDQPGSPGLDLERSDRSGWSGPGASWSGTGHNRGLAPRRGPAHRLGGPLPAGDRGPAAAHLPAWQ